METFMKTSKLTGRKYNAFDTVNLLNIQQCMAYIKRGHMPLDIFVSKNKETNQNCLVFIFSRSGTQEVYDLWCKHEL